MNFWQRQKVNMAARFLRWQYEKNRQPVPADPELEQQARRLVDEAGRITRRTGRNFVDILKELARDLKK